MQQTEKTSTRILLFYKIFFIGLLLQFFAHTFLTYIAGRTGPTATGFWLRKEILVIGGTGIALRYIRTHRARKEKSIIRYMSVLFFILLAYCLIVTLVQGGAIGDFAKARKYDLIGYMIFLTSWYVGSYISREQGKRFIGWVGRVIQWLLILGLMRYMVLLIKPGVLKLAGYDKLSIEGEVGKRPPAVYRTREFEGLPRNQFVFERPISRGFFLTAFFPLFFVQFLQKRSMKKTRFWWMVYALNVVTTYSRAARGSRIIELGILGVITYRKKLSHFVKKLLVPALVILLALAWVAKAHVIHREFSNTGHIRLLAQGREYFTSHPLFGMGAGSVGPASHHDGGLSFNPENQYLQIAIEFGIIGFILRMILYIWLHVIGGSIIRTKRKQKTRTTEERYITAFSIDMVGLSISGLVLHSFTDRMIVYPYMLIGGTLLVLLRKGNTMS